MSTTVLTGQKVYLGGYNLSCVLNAVSLSSEVDVKDATVLCDGTIINKAGLKTAAISLQGYFDADPYDQALFSNVGVSGEPITISTTATEGATAFFMKSMIGSYSPSGSIGEMFGFSVEAASADNLVRGTLMSNQTAVTTSADGTGRQLGAISAGQKLYAALHVLSASGTSPTLDITIESDDNAGFTSAATRMTFTQATGVEGQYLTLDGPITDDYWRVSWTTGGTTPSFDFVVVLGIM